MRCNSFKRPSELNFVAGPLSSGSIRHLVDVIAGLSAGWERRATEGIKVISFSLSLFARTRRYIARSISNVQTSRHDGEMHRNEWDSFRLRESVVISTQSQAVRINFLNIDKRKEGNWTFIIFQSLVSVALYNVDTSRCHYILSFTISTIYMNTSQKFKICDSVGSPVISSRRLHAVSLMILGTDRYLSRLLVCVTL